MEMPGQFLVEINRIAIFHNSFLREIVQQEMAECWRLKLGDIDMAQRPRKVHVNTKPCECVSGINYGLVANTRSGRSLPNSSLLGDIL